jgi:hypothetical protein
MTWYKLAKNIINETELNKRLKSLIKSSKFFIKLFEEYDIPIDRLDSLSFEIKDLDGKFAQSDAKTIYLNTELLKDSKFFDDGIHFVVHEITHWLTRQKEKDSYFADPEEIEAFSHAMAFELVRGKEVSYIKKVFFPIIEAHFSNEDDANKLFKFLLMKSMVRARKCIIV